MNKKYITTAIPYVNAKPHVGHAMDYLLADVWARYEKQQGNEVRYSAGTDEHGTKVEQKAREAGVSPQQFVDDLTPSFIELQDKLNIIRTDFIRTTDPKHIKLVEEIWQRLDAAGVIYKSTYQGWYCSGCESFVTESEAKAINYTCSDHQKPLEKLSEDNYYLRVSSYTEQIRKFAETAIVPEFRGKEILGLIKDGAKDVSISRPKEKLKWGVEVPGDDSQVMYVWVDALSNYITALGYPDESWDKDFWPAEVQVVGKDILRFHAIIWPAMLLALGLELPKKLLVHGHINVGGTKMSKSLGSVIDPIALIDDYGVDATRYFFLKHIPTFDDGDYTKDKFIAAYNGELANDLGNLVSRTANMVKRYLDGEITKTMWQPFAAPDFKKYMLEFRYDMALAEVWKLIQDANRYVDEKRPWEVARSGGNVKEILDRLVIDIQTIATGLVPFLPETAAKITEIFSGRTVANVPILFPRIER
jgi:methionyl-tRNA synthetase